MRVSLWPPTGYTTERATARLVLGKGQLHDKEVSVRSLARSIIAVAVTFGVLPPASSAQVRGSVVLTASPLFTGASFGVTRTRYDHTSVFFGSAITHHPRVVVRGVVPGPAHYGASCYDSFWFTDRHCVVTVYNTPAIGWGHAYWVPEWQRYRYAHRPRYAYVADPFFDVWGPYWAYDPWSNYWNAYLDPYVSRPAWDRARAYSVARASSSPFSTNRTARTTRFKERPVSARTADNRRTARPRHTTQPATTSPRASNDSDGARRRVPAVNRRAPVSGVSSPATDRRASRPAATSDRRRSAAPRPEHAPARSGAERVPAVGRRPVAAARTTRGSPISRPAGRAARPGRAEVGVRRGTAPGDPQSRQPARTRAVPEAPTRDRATPRGTSGRSRSVGSMPQRTGRPASGTARAAPTRPVTAPARGGRAGLTERSPSLTRRPSAPRAGSAPPSRSRAVSQGAARTRAATPRAARARPSQTRVTPTRAASGRAAPVRAPQTRPVSTPRGRPAPPRRGGNRRPGG